VNPCSRSLAGTTRRLLRISSVSVRMKIAPISSIHGSTDAPKPPLAAVLGRLLYLVHLAVLLWWLLDKSPKPRTTASLVALTRQLLPSAALTLRLPPIRRFLMAMDDLIREGLFGSPAEA